MLFVPGEPVPGFNNVILDPRFQFIQVCKFFLIPNLVQEIYIQVFTVDIFIEIKNINFHMFFFLYFQENN